MMRFILLSLLVSLLSGCGRQDVGAPGAERSRGSPSPAALVAEKTAGAAGAAAGGESVRAASLPIYQLKIEPRDLSALEQNPGSSRTYPATFVAEDGEVFEGVSVRFRGEWARTWPKKPLKIFFDRKKPFRNHHSINLNSAWRDPAFVREPLAYHVYAVCGAPAPRSRVVALEVNGAFRGLYVEVEQVDKPFLRRFNLRGAGLYKATSNENMADERDLGTLRSFSRHYGNESDPTNSLEQVQRFCRALNLATNAADFFAQHVEVDLYLNYLVATVLVQHWDGFNKNHFLVQDVRGSQKWLVIPWDLDRTFGDHWRGDFDRADLSIRLGTRQLPGVTGWNRLQDQLWNEPALRKRLLDRLELLLRTEFTTEKLFPLLDQYESALAAEAAQDRRLWPGVEENLHTAMVGLKHFIEQRRAFLSRELVRLRPAPPQP
jgi:spore coat protein H